MTEQSFVQRREPAWNEFAVLVKGNKRDRKTNAVIFVQYFRELSQDLNIAKSHGFDPAIIERLNLLVNEGNQILYGQSGWSLKIPARFIWQTFPQKVRCQWRGILAVTLLFYGLMFFFILLCISFPDISREIISAHTLAQMEDMYNPESAHFLTPREVSGDADMFGFYIYNNISIAFRAFAGGILAGIGSLFILGFNAVYLGTIIGHLINSGFSETLFPFVIAHGSFELTAIVFSGYAGLLLGYRFFITNGLSRGDSIKKAGQDALPIIAGAAIMLVIAAAIEAFWSSKHFLPIRLRIGVGVTLWVLLLLYFLFAGRSSSGTGKNSESAV